MENSAPNYTFNLLLFLSLVASVTIPTHVGSMPVDLQPLHKFEPANTQAENYPIPEARNDQRRQLAPFQLCLSCKCCAATSPVPTCTSMPCCFAIDCQIPNKPFGFCALVPKTCNCTSCAV